MAHDVRSGQEKLKVGTKAQLGQSETQRALLGGWPGVYLLRFAWTSVGKRPAVPKRWTFSPLSVANSKPFFGQDHIQTSRKTNGPAISPSLQPPSPILFLPSSSASFSFT